MMALTTYPAFIDSLLGHIMNNRSCSNSTIKCAAEVHQKLHSRLPKPHLSESHIRPQTDDSYELKKEKLWRQIAI